MALWDQNFYDKKVGGATVIEQLLTPGTLNDGSKLEYAGGLFITSYKGLKTVVHSGSTLGYQGTLHRFPEQHFSAMLLCNVRGVNPDSLARGVADIYLADQLKPTVATQGAPMLTPATQVKLSEKELSRVTGNFLLSPRFVDSFANPEEMGSLMFTRDHKNRVSGFVIRSGKVRNLRFRKLSA